MSDSLTEWVAETLTPFGHVTSRKMFGGSGLYLDGAIFALLAYDEIWLKSDAETDAFFDAAGCARFEYDFGEKKGTMNYRQLPSAAYDDADELTRLARPAIEAGMRAAAKKTPKKPRKRA